MIHIIFEIEREREKEGEFIDFKSKKLKKL